MEKETESLVDWQWLECEYVDVCTKWWEAIGKVVAVSDLIQLMCACSFHRCARLEGRLQSVWRSCGAAAWRPGPHQWKRQWGKQKVMLKDSRLSNLKVWDDTHLFLPTPVAPYSLTSLSCVFPMDAFCILCLEQISYLKASHIVQTHFLQQWGSRLQSSFW